MSRKFLAGLLVLAGMTAVPMMAATYEVGTCVSGVPKANQFTTITDAINAAAPSSTIWICPGTYPEQLYISKPLTLHGRSQSNTDRPVVTVPLSNIGGEPGLLINVTSVVTGWEFAAQIVVKNVNPPGQVKIFGITVDGSGYSFGCSAQMAGIFYASGTSGIIGNNTLRYQQNGGCGYPIWVENGAAPVQTIFVNSNSVHDFGNTGITAASSQVPSFLTAYVRGNFVTGGTSPADILTLNTAGSIARNVVTGGTIGMEDTDLDQQAAGIVIEDNVVADVLTSPGVGIVAREGDTASSNQVSNVTTAFYLQGGSTASPGPSLQSNTVKNVHTAFEYDCTANATVKTNTVNDAAIAYDNVPSGTASDNSLYNVDTILSGGCAL